MDVPEKITVYGIEYELEQWVSNDENFDGWHSYAYNNKETGLPAMVSVKYDDGIFKEYLVSFSEKDEDAKADIINRINNIV